jgi:hypothetical protein
MRNSGNQVAEIFVTAVKKIADSAMQYSNFVFSLYGIKQLQNYKQQISIEVGVRATRLLQEGTFDLSRDALFSELTARLNDIELELSKHEKLRNSFVNPLKAKKKSCVCTTNCQGKE